MTDDSSEERKKIYAETRDDLLARMLSNSERYDGAILTLSTASLGVSMAFIRNLSGPEVINYKSLLVISWASFGCAVITTLISFLVSQKSIKTQLLHAEKYYLNRDESYQNRPNIAASATEILNAVSGAFFVAALLLTIIFVSNNV